MLSPVTFKRGNFRFPPGTLSQCRHRCVRHPDGQQGFMLLSWPDFILVVGVLARKPRVKRAHWNGTPEATHNTGVAAGTSNNLVSLSSHEFIGVFRISEKLTAKCRITSYNVCYTKLLRYRCTNKKLSSRYILFRHLVSPLSEMVLPCVILRYLVFDTAGRNCSRATRLSRQ